MVSSSPAPVVIAAVVNKTRREITGYFMQMSAVTPADAVAFVPNRPIARRQFEKMLAKGVVKEAGPGRYWLDTHAYNADIAARRRRLVPVVIMVFVLLAAVLTLLYRG